MIGPSDDSLRCADGGSDPAALEIEAGNNDPPPQLKLEPLTGLEMINGKLHDISIDDDASSPLANVSATIALATSSSPIVAVPPPPPRSEIDHLIGRLLRNNIWRVAFDPATGRPYYYCCVDGSTTWDLALLIRTLRSIEMMAGGQQPSSSPPQRHTMMGGDAAESSPNSHTLNLKTTPSPQTAHSNYHQLQPQPGSNNLVAPAVATAAVRSPQQNVMSQSQRIADAKRRRMTVGSPTGSEHASTEQLSQKLVDVEKQMKHFDSTMGTRRSVEPQGEGGSNQRRSKSPDDGGGSPPPSHENPTAATAEFLSRHVAPTHTGIAITHHHHPRGPASSSSTAGAGSSWLVSDMVLPSRRTETTGAVAAAPATTTMLGVTVPLEHFSAHRRRMIGDQQQPHTATVTSRNPCRTPMPETTTRPVLGSSRAQQHPPVGYSPGRHTLHHHQHQYHHFDGVPSVSDASLNREVRRLGTSSNMMSGNIRYPSPIAGSPHGMQRSWKDELFKREEELIMKRNRLRREREEHRRRAHLKSSRLSTSTSTGGRAATPHTNETAPANAI